MRLATVALVLASLAGPGAQAKDKLPQWVLVRSIGAQDKPYPILWFSAEAIAVDTARFETLVQLPADQYTGVVRYVRAAPCPRTAPKGRILFEVADARAVLCERDQQGTCVFLKGLAALPGLAANPDVDNLQLRLGCKPLGQGL
jgi:hypothetical protein